MDICQRIFLLEFSVEVDQLKFLIEGTVYVLYQLGMEINRHACGAVLVP